MAFTLSCFSFDRCSPAQVKHHIKLTSIQCQSKHFILTVSFSQLYASLNVAFRFRVHFILTLIPNNNKLIEDILSHAEIQQQNLYNYTFCLQTIKLINWTLQNNKTGDCHAFQTYHMSERKFVMVTSSRRRTRRELCRLQHLHLAAICPERRVEESRGCCEALQTRDPPSPFSTQKC